MYRFKLMILGLCVVSCMIHGAAETKVAQEYAVEIVPVKQMRWSCLARLRERCYGKPSPVIVNTTPNTIPIKFHGFDITDIPDKALNTGATVNVTRNVDRMFNLMGNTKVATIKYSESSDIKFPQCDRCPSRLCICAIDFLITDRNPKKFTLNPESGSSPTYDLKPGFTYRIVAKAKKSEKLKGS